MPDPLTTTSCEIGETQCPDAALTRQAQRLECIGRLVPGMAHEINTPIQFTGDSIYFVQSSVDALLTVLTAYRRLAETAYEAGFAPVLLEELRAAEDHADLAYLTKEIPLACERAAIGVKRVAEITRAMQALARRGPVERAPHDLSGIIQTVLVVARNEYKYVADLEVELEPLPPVVCDAKEIGQAILALLVAAADAIAEDVKGSDRRGRIEVRTRREGRWAIITVSETGCGASVGPAMNHGLAVARAIIVDSHGGALAIENDVADRTTAHLKLPLQQMAGLEEM